MSEYQCVFCGEKIDRSKVTSILISTNWDSGELEECNQQFFCHLNCFKAVSKNSKYIMLEE